MINKSVKILLIEDNPGDARLIKEILAEANDVIFDIKWATYLSNGLELLSSESFDGILLDLSLPDSFGIETFLKVKKHAPEIPIIILTGLDDESLGLKAVRGGAQDYLVKGYLNYCNLLTHDLLYAIERHKIEKALQDSERQYRTTINSMGDAIHLVDKDLRFILFNKTFKQWNKRLGFNTDVIEKTIFEVFPFLPDKVRNEYRKVFETGKVIITEEYNKIGDEEFITETRKIPVFEAGKVVRVVTVIRDITKPKKAERILKRDKETFERLVNEKTEELVEVQRKLSDSKRLSDIGLLAATVAHELRSPLAVIRMACFNIRQKRLNPLIDKNLDNIEIRISDCNQIIQNLLFYSRIKMPHFENIDISLVLEECICDLSERLNRKMGTLHKNWSVHQPFFIEADRLQIKELFINILNNAYDAVKDQTGEIEVDLESNINGFIKLSLKDNGSGLSEKDLKMVYEPFFSTKSNGTGLGLTICLQIVKLHDGHMEILSKKDKGTTVIVNLPIKHNVL
ncbi:MAG: ATP-binding protein [bacterium]